VAQLWASLNDPMRKLFNNLLVPVVISGPSISGASEDFIRKAVGVANLLRCNVHLLYFSRSRSLATGIDGWQSLLDMHKQYQPALAPSLFLSGSLLEGPAREKITSYYQKNDIDLILLEKRESSFMEIFRDPLWTSGLSKKIKCPILTVYSGSRLSDIRNIVLPVGHFLPLSKLIAAVYLARISHSTIHLISTDNDNSPFLKGDSGPLYRSYRLLRDNTNLSIQYSRMEGTNIAAATLAYARNIQADLIVIGRGRESLLSGFLNGLRRDLLFKASPIPVMTVS
jgi:hypothetical protein